MLGIQSLPSRRHVVAPQRLRVFRTDPQSDPRWHAFLSGHPDGTIYHHPKWIRVIEDEYGQQSEHLACEDEGGRFLAIMPMLYTRGLPLNLGGSSTGKRLSSLPRTPLAGPLSSSPHATAAILREAVAKSRQEPGMQLQIKGSRELDPLVEGQVEGLVGIPWRVSYVLRLPDQSQGPFRIADGQERAKIKWAINKAAKLGVVVRPAETEADLRAWYRIYLETMRRNAVPPRPYRFFTGLWEILRPAGMMELLLAELPEGQRKTVIAGSVFLNYGTTVSYAFNGMDRKHGSLRANDAIQWHAINAACRGGFRSFDFGEVPEGHTELARFKSKWGAQPARLHRYHCPDPCPGDPSGDGNSGESESRIQSMAYAVWRRLPLGVTERVGDWLYSYL